MKKPLIILLSTFLLGLNTQMRSQDVFPTNNAHWNIRVDWWNMSGDYGFWEERVRSMIYSIEGDTIINGVSYNKLYYNYDFLGGFRQEDQKVWFWMNGGEYLLYDFGVSEGVIVWHNLSLSNTNKDPVPFIDMSSHSIIQAVGTIDGIRYIYTRSYSSHGEGEFNTTWVEGTGSDVGPFGHLPVWQCLCENVYTYYLGCFMLNDEIKYIDNYNCSSCFDCPFCLPLGINDAQITIMSYPYNNPVISPVTLQDLYPFYGLPPFTYHWSTNSETYIIEDSVSSSITFSFSGELDVYLKKTDKRGHVAYDTLTLITNVGIQDKDISNNISFYPNPTNGEIKIKNYELRMGDMQIYDMTGRMVYRYEVQGDGYEVLPHTPLSEPNTPHLIDISYLQSGIYFLKIDNQTFKIIKN